MNDKIEKAIERLADKSAEVGVTSGQAMQYAQATLNLAHAAQVLAQVAKTKSNDGLK